MLSDRDTPPWRVCVLRAVLYALAVTALALFAPAPTHVFIYQGF